MSHLETEPNLAVYQRLFPGVADRACKPWKAYVGTTTFPKRSLLFSVIPYILTTLTAS